MAEDDALFAKGMPIRREVLGPEYVDASMARADDFMMSFQRATTAWAWGWAWGDKTLDRQTRSLMNLAMLTALNRAPEIKLHVKGALNNGVTVEEIKAAFYGQEIQPKISGFVAGLGGGDITVALLREIWLKAHAQMPARDGFAWMEEAR